MLPSNSGTRPFSADQPVFPSINVSTIIREPHFSSTSIQIQRLQNVPNTNVPRIAHIQRVLIILRDTARVEIRIEAIFADTRPFFRLITRRAAAFLGGMEASFLLGRSGFGCFELVCSLLL